MQQALRVRRNVKQKQAVAAHGAIVDTQKVLQAAHTAALLFMIKPTGPNRYIHLRGIPHKGIVVRKESAASEILQTTIRSLLFHILRICLLGVGGDILRFAGKGRHNVPLAFSGAAALVAHPADIGAAV